MREKVEAARSVTWHLVMGAKIDCMCIQGSTARLSRRYGASLEAQSSQREFSVISFR